MRFLVTGTAGFIGFHVASRILNEGHEVVGVDGFTDYYDVTLKERRNAILTGHNGFSGERLMLEDFAGLEHVWRSYKPDVVIHLAGQAGVRYSLENPRAYVDSNVTGTFNLLELARAEPVRHFMLASTSSLYGANEKIPFAETDLADHPLTLYAATKKATELMSHSYAHLFGIPVTAFRFFTIYGTWGRPDMAFFKFTRNILEGKPIDVYNNGDMRRDFTYVADLVEAIWRLQVVVPEAPAARTRAPHAGDTLSPQAIDSISPQAPWRVVNIGGGSPVALMDFIAEIEKACGKKAICNMLPMQPGDVPQTYASSGLLEHLTEYKPSTPLSEGIPEFVKWCREYYGI
ncbi:MAG: NAD-dependent epimerase/dehydratase family protein [Beijerinckiaceae bacterium]